MTLFADSCGGVACRCAVQRRTALWHATRSRIETISVTDTHASGDEMMSTDSTTEWQGERQAKDIYDALADLGDEVTRQDEIHPAGYAATRDGVRLGLATVGDELQEALDAWRPGRCKCRTPECGHHDWSEVRKELLQTAAVIMRTIRSIDAAPRPERHPGWPKDQRVEVLR
jgi:hypothetical protein